MIQSALLLLFHHHKSRLPDLRGKCFVQDKQPTVYKVGGRFTNFSPRACFQVKRAYPLENDGTSEIFKTGVFDESQ